MTEAFLFSFSVIQKIPIFSEKFIFNSENVFVRKWKLVIIIRILILYFIWKELSVFYSCTDDNKIGNI